MKSARLETLAQMRGSRLELNAKHIASAMAACEGACVATEPPNTPYISLNITIIS